MPFYAYPNEDRNIDDIIYAENVTQENKLDTYYCPTRGCDARMYVRYVDNNDKKTHFVCKRNLGHSDFCKIGREHFEATDYDEDMFDFNRFMETLLEPQQENNTGGQGHGDGDGNTKPISTVRQLYLQCINMDINQRYNGNLISDILVDNRTNHIYTCYIRGYHLVECYCYRYDAENNIYYARYWLNDDQTEYITLKLKFANNKLYKKLTGKGIFKRNIVVAGLWENAEDDMFSVNINRTKQIHILK